MTHYVCGKCNKMCERTEVKHTDVEEFWGAPANRDSYEDLSDCCNDDAHTVDLARKTPALCWGESHPNRSSLHDVSRP